MEFRFNRQRVRVLTKVDEVAPESKGILYWMFRDARVQGKSIFLIFIKLLLIDKKNISNVIHFWNR